LHQIDIRCARGRGDGLADVLCELNCKCSHATGAGVDEDFLPLLQVCSFNQRLPGGQANQRDGSGFLHGEFLWLERHVVFIHRNEFRESADPIFMRPRIDLVAELESPHVGPDPDHDPSHIVSQNERQAIRQNELELSVSDLGIQDVYAGSVDTDQYIRVPQFRLRHFDKPDAIILSITFDDERLHDLLSLILRRRLLSESYRVSDYRRKKLEKSIGKTSEGRTQEVEAIP